jgi:hypothetical protein
VLTSEVRGVVDEIGARVQHCLTAGPNAGLAEIGHVPYLPERIISSRGRDLPSRCQVVGTGHGLARLCTRSGAAISRAPQAIATCSNGHPSADYNYFCGACRICRLAANACGTR